MRLTLDFNQRSMPASGTICGTGTGISNGGGLLSIRWPVDHTDSGPNPRVPIMQPVATGLSSFRCISG